MYFLSNSSYVASSKVCALKKRPYIYSINFQIFWLIEKCFLSLPYETFNNYILVINFISKLSKNVPDKIWVSDTLEFRDTRGKLMIRFHKKYLQQKFDSLARKTTINSFYLVEEQKLFKLYYRKTKPVQKI